MIALDSNVLLRFVAQDDPDQSRLATEFMATLTEDEPGFVSLIVLVEVAWVLRRGYKFPPHVIHDHLEGLLGANELEFEEGETAWDALLQARNGADFADALIAGTARMFLCDEVVTFDKRAATKLGMRLLA